MAGTTAPKSAPVKRNVYRMSEVVEQMTDALGGPSLEIVLDDAGTTVHPPNPFVYTAEVKTELKKLKEDDMEGVAQVLLGDEYDKYIAAGFTPENYQLLMMRVQKDLQATYNELPTR